MITTAEIFNTHHINPSTFLLFEHGIESSMITITVTVTVTIFESRRLKIEKFDSFDSIKRHSIVVLLVFIIVKREKLPAIFHDIYFGSVNMKQDNYQSHNDVKGLRG